MNILVLGHTGMLGSMNFRYLTYEGIQVSVCPFRYPSDKFENYISNFHGDAIINCIGAIPQKTNNFSVNIDLPIWLDENTDCKVVYPASDCEDNFQDDYSASKKKSLEYLVANSKRTKVIKSSIIGPEVSSNKCIFEWFLSSEGAVSGYTGSIWNGMTTLEWSKQCLNLISNWDSYEVKNVFYSDPLSKFDLLTLIKKIFNKKIQIIPVKKGFDRYMEGNIKIKKIEDQLIELKDFMKKNKLI